MKRKEEQQQAGGGDGHSLPYPPVVPFGEGWLPVGEGYEIYLERYGRQGGEPLLFLHGGPGSGLCRDQARLFDPARFEIIQFDQRGCGKSRPHGVLRGNETGALIRDIETLLDLFGYERVHLAGGSWGSALALAYGVRYPHRLASLLLYGVFLCRESELRALYYPGGLASQLFPDEFERFISLLEPESRSRPLEGYGGLFASFDEKKRQQALSQWTRLEKRLSRLVVEESELERELANPDYVLSHSLIENHYFRHGCFMDGDELLTAAAEAFAGLHVEIVSGQYDLICPPRTAWELHRALPHSRLTMVPAAGHSFRQPAIAHALAEAGRRLPVI